MINMRTLSIVLFAVACSPNSGRNDSPSTNGHGGGSDLGVNHPPNGADLAGSPTTGGMTFSDMCNGTQTTITGTVLAPNGKDPIAAAFAYVPSTRTDFPPTVSCELCNMQLDTPWATATSASDGTFTLDIGAVPFAPTVQLTVNKGRFRHTATVSVTPCQSNNAADTALPGKTKAGVDDIPKIAVATGNQDQLDTVLGAMGLDTSVGFDCFEGRIKPTGTNTLKKLTTPCGTRSNLTFIEDFLSNETMLENYNIVFLSCVPGKFKSLTATQQSTIVANLQTWTQKGGRLFVTDNSYDYLAQAFPSAVNFLDGNTGIDAANMGVGGSTSAPVQYQGRVNDSSLATWLSVIGAIPSGTSTLTLNGYLNKWSVIASVPMTTVDEVDATNAQAYTSLTPSPSPGPASTYPQSVKFDIDSAGQACGRAIYTSYHTLLSTTTSIDPNVMLSPQERILEYLMFEAGACVGPVS
jgi:hypothetical protein